MTKFDKALQVLGAVSGSLVVAHASGQLPLPKWAIGVCGALAYLPTALSASLLPAKASAPPAPPAPPAA